MNESEVAIKYGISERRVKIIRRRKPLICQDNDFHKFERIREFGCLDEFKFGKIDPMDLTNIFCEASRSIVKETSKKCYGHLIYPIEPRELELRHAICDILSSKKFNYIIECPIKNPYKDSNK